MLGYAMLAWSYWNALELKSYKGWLAWLLAILYAVTDEYHQSFVTGRFPSALDVIVFDNLGALIALSVAAGKQEKQKLRVSHPKNRDSLSIGSSE